MPNIQHFTQDFRLNKRNARKSEKCMKANVKGLYSYSMPVTLLNAMHSMASRTEPAQI